MKKDKVVILIAARMNSKRLPRKCMKIIEGQPMVCHLIDRMKVVKNADEVMLCTSTNPDDDILIEQAIKKGVSFVKGSEDDVMERFLLGAEKTNANIIVRVTGDNPLTSPYFIEKAIEHHIKTNADYTSTTELPQGTKGEIISVSALKKAYELAEDSNYSEYLTWYFTDNPEFFNIQKAPVEDNLKRSQYRLTVDAPEDFELVSKIYKKLYRPGEIIPLDVVIKFLDENPEIANINFNAKVKSKNIKEIKDKINVKLKNNNNC